MLEAAGSSWEKVVKVNVYLKNMDDFAAMNDIYEKVGVCAVLYRAPPLTGAHIAPAGAEAGENLHSSGQVAERCGCRNRGHCDGLTI